MYKKCYIYILFTYVIQIISNNVETERNLQL